MSKPLSGLLVLSLEQAVAAPLAARKLADAGARVIKIERPEGDFARGYDSVANGQSSFFVWLNRGKESVVADLSREEDRALVAAIARKADVLVQNLKPGSLDKLGLAISALRADNPRLITCSISGYGDHGPYAKRKAYDLLIQAESGLASVTGAPEEPGRIGVSAVDISTGMTAYEAILEALIARNATGHAADLKLSMFDTMAEIMAVPIIHGLHGRETKRIGLSHPLVSPYGVFGTRDGKSVLIAIQNEREWRVLCAKVLARPELATDERFASNVARVANRPATDGLIADWFANLDLDEACRRLDAADIAYGRVSEVSDVIAHPHLRRMTVATPEGPVEMPAVPVIVDGAALSCGAVPRLGEQTVAVRREFLTTKPA